MRNKSEARLPSSFAHTGRRNLYAPYFPPSESRMQVQEQILNIGMVHLLRRIKGVFHPTNGLVSEGCSQRDQIMSFDERIWIPKNEVFLGCSRELPH